MNHRFKYIKAYILCALICVAVSSCFKDKGNYNYNEITTVSIDSFGNKAAYYLDSLIISPKINVSPDPALLDDTSRYSFLWTAAVSNRVAAKGDVPLLTLGTSKNLRIKLTMRPEKYTLYFKILDKLTSNVYYMQCILNVATTTQEGWLLLTDVNNEARLDMVSFLPAPLSDTLILTNLLKNNNMPTVHGPRDIAYTAANQGNWVYFTGVDGGHKLDADVFYWQSNYNLKYECLFEYGANFTPGYVRNSDGGGSYLLYYGNNFYYQNQVLAAGYGLPLNRVAGENFDFNASPYIGKPIPMSNPGVIFDRTKGRFLRLNINLNGSTSCVEFPQLPITDPNYKFNYKTTMELKFMVTNQNSLITYAVLKDPATQKVWVYSMTVTSTGVVQNFAKEISGTDIQNAEQFAVSPEFGYLFYNVGGKVYEVDYDNPSVSKLAIDLGNKKITLLKFHQFILYSLEKYSAIAKRLLVATYDPSLPAESCGTLNQYSVPGLVGTPVLTGSWPGVGKIVSLTYRERPKDQ
ncbi:PKD-like family lipoprotein [Niastella sp. OAS944]|uniref:PKD-like family lipoprotein n=1 Tax=Niastella sp. OAS944 TaxID=2664089 RepID=UPI003474596E|nr:hypothetical protein [Chitinophagaceae bacterium OAS944]